MSIQEAALYGDLVLALRDYAAGQLADAAPAPSADLPPEAALDAARARMDDFIRTWFFTPQKKLYDSAPREVIWREQVGEPNVIPREYAAEAFDDDCPICQEMRREIETAEDGVDHGHHWTYCPDSCLLDSYDPEGSDERWSEEVAQMDEGEAEQEQARLAPEYTPPPTPPPQLTPDEFLSVLRRPWLDPELHRAAQELAEHCDVPQPPGPGRARSAGSGQAPYRRITRDEALSLITGLHKQNVDVQALMAQVDAWPYRNIALDWLSDPEGNVAFICQALDQVAPGDEAELARFRHHRDFILTLARLIPAGARLWLSGWLEAVTYGAMMAPF
ncbi:MAG: hypothetical protein CVU38_16245 [Chloroflexi bacterium HGW-Chloroflexi-1]|nr:MAG: hypothetical protein CVU38_16245 [Chloroflexi bacterium HGW-Chloroflexi-1]